MTGARRDLDPYLEQWIQVAVVALKSWRWKGRLESTLIPIKDAALDRP